MFETRNTQRKQQHVTLKTETQPSS